MIVLTVVAQECSATAVSVPNMIDCNVQSGNDRPRGVEAAADGIVALDPSGPPLGLAGDSFQHERCSYQAAQRSLLGHNAIATAA